MNVSSYFSLVLLISAFSLIYIGYFSWKRNKLYIAISLIPVSIYEFGYAFEILCTSIEWVKFWIKVEYIGVSFLPVAWLMFALNFTGQKMRVKRNTLILLNIVPAITLIANYTNDLHHLFYKKIYMNNNGIFPIVELIKGPFYWINIAYTYTVMLIGLIIFIFAYFKSVSIVKKQILLLIIAWILPWISDIIYMLGVLPIDIDLCPLAFSISGIMSSFAIFKFKLLKLTPIALEKVFSNMLDGVIILDAENNIVNFNNSSKNIISELKYIEAGDKKIGEVLKEYSEVLKAINSDLCNESLITIKNNGQSRYYKMNINNIYESSGEIIGKILIFNDVTEIELQRKDLSNNLNFLQTLMDAIPNPIYSKDEHGVYNHCNTAFIEFLGSTTEEILGNTVSEVFEKDLAETYNKSDKDLREKKGIQVFESKLMHVDGTHHDVIFSKSVIKSGLDDNGLVGVIIDITEKKKNEEKINKLLKLKESMLKIGYSINEITDINDLLQLILNEVIDCVDDTSCGSVLLLQKDNSLKIAASKGYDLEEVKKFTISLDDAWCTNGETIGEAVILNDIDKMEALNILDTAEGIEIKSAMSSPIIIDNQFYGFLNIDSIYNNIFDEGDLELIEYMGNQASIAISKHKLYEEILYLSRYDKLTNVYNRSYFEQLLYDDIHNDNGNEKEFYAVVFDLNGLKFVNDNYGHLAGDELINAFSKGLTSLAGDSDIIGRFGGDEFVGVFYNIDFQILVNRFEGLIEKFKNNPIVFEENEIICSFSYGIVKYPRDGRDFNKLIKIADEHMYEYKREVKKQLSYK